MIKFDGSRFELQRLIWELFWSPNCARKQLTRVINFLKPFRGCLLRRSVLSRMMLVRVAAFIASLLNLNVQAEVGNDKMLGNHRDES